MGIKWFGECPVQTNNAGNKARVDIDNLLFNRYGEAELILAERLNDSFIEKIKRFLTAQNYFKINQINRVKDETVILQYPFYFKKNINDALFKAIENNNVILFVHDVNSLRNIDGLDVHREISLFNSCKLLVVHNEIMKEALIKMGCTSKMVSLECFDYLMGCIPPVYTEDKFCLQKPIAFAGNLGKSDFLKNIRFTRLKSQFNLYGPNFDEKLIRWNNVIYKGSYLPTEIPYKLEGSFGLIWDGEALETCSGSMGEYLKYNNPHKLSLYIAAGLPVMVWERCAIANFVKDYQIGVTIDSLEQIDIVTKCINQKKYDLYLQNIRNLQQKVCKGYFTNIVLEKIENLLKTKVQFKQERI